MAGAQEWTAEYSASPRNVSEQAWDFDVTGYGHIRQAQSMTQTESLAATAQLKCTEPICLKQVPVSVVDFIDDVTAGESRYRLDCLPRILPHDSSETESEWFGSRRPLDLRRLGYDMGSDRWQSCRE